MDATSQERAFRIILLHPFCQTMDQQLGVEQVDLAVIEDDIINNSLLRRILREVAEPVIQNVVATVDLTVELDLKLISHSARMAEYNPKRFAAVIMRLRDPKTTALVFKSGKMVCTGAKSEEASYTASRKYAKIIQKLGFPVRFEKFTIQNMVASFNFGHPIKLDLFKKDPEFQQFVQYEPEIFPGLIFRQYKQQKKITLLIFVSGKVVITGAKDVEDVTRAFHHIIIHLDKFKKQD